MARKPRLHFPGAVYHVMLRGNGGQDIFFDSQDRHRLYLLLAEGTVRFGYRVHGFCLMTNHVHLAIQVADQPLSQCMQNLSFRYTRWINRRQGRTGHLFQGRYKAVVVEQDSYLVELVRYIHLNPVRARLVSDVFDYPWTGHRAYLGKEEIPWLTTDWVLGQFGTRRSVARRRYKAFIKQGLSEGYREEFHGGSKKDGRLLGADRFIEAVLAPDDVRQTPPGLDEIAAVVCVEYGINEEELAAPTQRRDLSEARALFGWLVNDLSADADTGSGALPPGSFVVEFRGAAFAGSGRGGSGCCKAHEAVAVWVIVAELQSCKPDPYSLPSLTL